MVHLCPCLVLFLIISVNVKLFVELWIMSLLKSLRGTAMTRGLTSGRWEFYYINWRVERLLLKQKIKISHMKKLLKVNALFHNFSALNLNILLTKFLIKIHQKDQILTKFKNINGFKNIRLQEDSFVKIFGQHGAVWHEKKAQKNNLFQSYLSAVCINLFLTFKSLFSFLYFYFV